MADEIEEILKDIEWDHEFPCGCRVLLVPETHAVVTGQCDWHWRMTLSIDFENW